VNIALTPYPQPDRTTSEPRPLALPVTRTRSKSRAWLWFAGYHALLFVLDAPLAWVIAHYENAAMPGGLIFLTVCDCLLLVPLFTTLAGTLLGKWRGALVPPVATVLWFCLVAILASLHPSSAASTSTSSSTSENGWLVGIAIALCCALPSAAAFLTGWIYQRRQRAQFGWSFLSQLAGLALLMVPLLILLGIAETSSSAPMDIFVNVITVCLLILGVAPLALLASGLEALMHGIVKRSSRAVEV
jgi:hypothetical protein